MSDIWCIGSVLWDVIGRSEQAMPFGADRPGRITRLPGGVALNIAMTLVQFGVKPGLVSSVGMDDDGTTLLERCVSLGLATDHVLRHPTLPTDRYMAIEDTNGLIAAIADAHSLEAAGADILSPFADGRLGDADEPYSGPLAVDGNLTDAVLNHIATDVCFRKADLRIAPASPGKALRLKHFIEAKCGTLYVNLEEAALLCGATFSDAKTAAQALLDQGAGRALVTNGEYMAADASALGVSTATPPKVRLARVTGAGDTFMAAHIAAEISGTPPAPALQTALDAAAAYVSGKSTP